MNLIGIGPQELIVILVVALIFVGPQRLPKLAADLARMIREVRQYTGGIASEFNQAIKEFEEDTQPEREQWKEIGQGLGGVSKEATSLAEGVRSDAEGAPADTPRPTEAQSPPAPADAPKPPEAQSPPAPVATPSNGATAAPDNAAAPEPAATREERA